MFGSARRTWVLGGGGARGAAQVGVLQALFEAGVEAPAAIVGTSVGALNGASIAAYPSLAGTMMLREVWLSRQAAAVFQAHPLGVILSGLRRDRLSVMPQNNVLRLIERAESLTGMTTFEQRRVPLKVVATDMNAGKPAVFRSERNTAGLPAFMSVATTFSGTRRCSNVVMPVNDSARSISRSTLFCGITLSLSRRSPERITPSGWAWKTAAA